MLGHYEPLVRLGRGGMASVWVAREFVGGDQRLLALKAMLPELAHHSDFRTMFLEEGQIIRSIDHPNVVKVHDVGEDRGVLYMAMEWVEGDSLRALIQEARRRRPIPAEIAVKVIADAAAGLHAAHELRGWDGELRNVVHCDVSPHNILVGIDGRAKIVDFGVANARLHGDFGGDEKVKGKFAYMSPEQASNQRIDRRSDVFALGIVLYELTTGERLFRGETPAHTLHLVTEAPLPDPRSTHPDYPERLAPIVRKALERDPSRRFQTADALREALERFLVEERILVSHGSVAQLVKRVLGTRIEQLRQNLRETLTAKDGALRAELIPDTPATVGTFTGVLTGEQAVVVPPRPSAYSGTPRPQSFSPPPPHRSGLPPFLAAMGGIAAAVSSIVWMMNRPGAAPMAAPTLQDKPRAQEPLANPEAARQPDNGVDISTIPLGEPSAVPPAHPAAPRTWRRPSAKSDARTPEPGAEELPIDLTTEPAPAAPGNELAAAPSASPERPGEAPAPEEVELEETPVAPSAAAAPAAPPAVAASGERGPFNRGAALAQLGSVAGRTVSCKRPNGPTGSGRASVTFGPDGRASKVALGAPFAGTPVGQCVTTAFQGARIPAFTGSPVTLPWSFRVPE
jgi:eukaryotic-like serine/threonine-protein kinase